MGYYTFLPRLVPGGLFWECYSKQERKHDLRFIDAVPIGKQCLKIDLYWIFQLFR